MKSNIFKEMVLGFKMLKYSMNIKMNGIMLLIMFIIGIMMDVISKGQNIMGTYMMLMSVVYIPQFFYGISVSSMVQSSNCKKKLLVNIPTIMIGIVSILMFAYICVTRYIFRLFEDASVPANYSSIILFSFVLLLLILYATVVFRKPIIGYIILMIFLLIYVPTVISKGTEWIWNLALRISFTSDYLTCVLIGGGFLVFDIIMLYVFSKALYKIPFSMKMWKRVLEQAK